MKLYTLDPNSRLATNITKISRVLKMDVLVKGVDVLDLDTIVVIGDGTPDDIAFSLIAYHLNGDEIAGIVKPPGRTGLGVSDLIPTYLKGKVRKIMVLMDQEDEPLNTICERTQNSLKKLAKCKIKIIDEEGKSEKRQKVYKCKYGGKEFELILVINGLDEIHTDKHTIEDHLLKVAEMLSIKVEDFETSKEAWKSIERRHVEIFKGLKEKRNIVGSVFPQQIKGCEYLKSIS
ncbi:MAG: hypothetical protein U9N41_01945 [Euryarchaeota archaeon]|nr:hypothetical protein [Euryarchaeota archaeon]